MKEGLQIVAENPQALGLLLIAFQMAFTYGVRQEIGNRDNWTCQDCGKKFKDGWMVHAAHNADTHHKSHPEYDHPDSGRILCVECHQEQHKNGTTLGRKDGYAIRKLKNTDRRTYEWRRKNGG